MDDATESDNTAITPEKKAKEAYESSWGYTVCTYGAKVAASMAVTALVAGALASAPAVIGGTVLASAVISVSATTASTAASLAMRSGYEKQIAKDVFTYKALGHKDYSERARQFLGEKGQGFLNNLGLRSFFEADDVLGELKILVNATNVQEGVGKVPDNVQGTEGGVGIDKKLRQLIESRNWTENEKGFIIAQIDKLKESIRSNQDEVILDSKEKLELLSELYAKLKLNLYDRNFSSVSWELGISVGTGLAGAGATAIWHNPFATTAARTAATYALQGETSFQNLLIAEASAEFGAAISAEVGHVAEEFRYSVAEEFKQLSSQQKERVLKDAGIGLRFTGDNQDLLALSGFELNKLHNELNKCCEDFTAVKQVDEAGDNNVKERRLSEDPSGDTGSYNHTHQSAHQLWKKYEDNDKDFTRKFIKHISSKSKDNDPSWFTKTGECQSIGQVKKENDVGINPNVSADAPSQQEEQLYQDLRKFELLNTKSHHDSRSSEPVSHKVTGKVSAVTDYKDGSSKNANTIPWYSDYPALGAGGALGAVSAFSSHCFSEQGTDAAPTSPTDRGGITNGGIKNAFMMSGDERKVRYYSIGEGFTESYVSNKDMAIQAIEGDFNKLEKNTGVILSSEVAKAEGKEDPKTISIVINKQQSEIGDILFRDARFYSLDNKDEKFYFKLSYKEGLPTLKIMRNSGEINFNALKPDEKKIFNSIEFDIIVKEGGQEKHCNFKASEIISTESFDWKVEPGAISKKSTELSDFAKAKDIQIDNINPKSPSNGPNLPGSASRHDQGRRCC